MKQLKVIVPGTEAKHAVVPVRKTAKYLNWHDILQGGIVAAVTPVLLLIEQSVDKGEWVFNPKALGMAAIGGFVAYLLKNVFRSPAVVIKTKDLPE